LFPLKVVDIIQLFCYRIGEKLGRVGAWTDHCGSISGPSIHIRNDYGRER